LLTAASTRRSAPACTRGLPALGACLLSLSAVTASADDRAAIIVSNGDAYIGHESSSDLWSIGSANIELVVGLDPSHALTLQRLWNPESGRSWTSRRRPT
jgi:hypothetical protein